MGLWNWLWGKRPAKADAPAAPRAVPAPITPPRSDVPARDTYGVASHDPVLCHQPSGERLYIASLRCPHGHRLNGPRLGSMAGKCGHPASHVPLVSLPGINPAEECLVDCYNLICEGGEFSCTLYFDMYHPDAPPQPAPRGLTRVRTDERGAR
jgi:hypothetical protein